MPAFPAITQIDGATETQQNGKQSAKSVKESTPASEKAATGSKRKGASADGMSTDYCILHDMLMSCHSIQALPRGRSNPIPFWS
jgi:hypothetical protein